MAVILRASSKAVRLRISRPLLAEIDVEMATTNGMATPSAWGQAVTITVTMRSMAKAVSLPSHSHAASVPKPPTSDTAVSQPAARSARVWVCDLVFCASLTIFTTLLR